MPALNFQPQFARAVRAGYCETWTEKNPNTLGMPTLEFTRLTCGFNPVTPKRQTIRAFRKDGRNPKAGDTLYLYTGMRSPKCEKLGEAVCTAVKDISITAASIAVSTPEGWHVVLPPHEAEELARKDGFNSLGAMLEWFQKTHGLPFRGLLIQW